MRIYDGGMTASNGALRRFCLLQPGFLGCAKLKQAALGDVTHVASYASGRDLSPGGTLLRMRAVAYCKILRRYEQPPEFGETRLCLKICASGTQGQILGKGKRKYLSLIYPFFGFRPLT